MNFFIRNGKISNAKVTKKIIWLKQLFDKNAFVLIKKY